VSGDLHTNFATDDDTRDALSPEHELTVLELLDRVLDKGVVLSGDVTLSVADIDLVYVGLRVLLSSVEAARRRRGGDEQLLPSQVGPP
jgi:hypothetical protein